MPYAPPTTNLPSTSSFQTPTSEPPKITFGIFSKSTAKSSTNTEPVAVLPPSPPKPLSNESKSLPVDMNRQQAVKKLRDILSTSPLSTSPSSRRNSAPESPIRRLQLKVDLPSMIKPTFEILRKKSGEIVKSSLKKGSKSEPVTPTCPKFVHFDTDLEQIRWFLEAEKPHAVSCDASDDDNDDDNNNNNMMDEVSSSSLLLLLNDDYNYDEDDDDDTADDDNETELVITLPNFPRMTTLHSSKSVFVERIFLSDDKRKLQGRIQVQNLAFHKSVTVRYTFDFWQTVSEIPASYIDVGDDRKNANLDTFVFSIDLIDKLRKSVNGQTMYFAVRYNVRNRDYWDNNNGSNYQVNFKKQIRPPPPRKSKRHRSKSYSYLKWSSSGQKSVKSIVSDELGRSPPSFVTTNLSHISTSSSSSSSSSSSQQKKMNNRYDINMSLSAAMTKKVPPPPSLSPGDYSSNTSDDNSNSSDSSSGSGASSHAIISNSSKIHHIRQYSYFSAAPYNNDNFNSYFPGNYIDGMPGTTDSSCEELSKLAKANLEVSRSTPIAIPKPSMSYYELVDRYCFYQGSPPVITAHSPPIST